MKYLPERIFFLFFVVFALTFFPDSATRASEVDPTQRVRIAECFNSPPSGILLLQINDAFLGLAEAPPVWQTLTAKTDAERRNLERASVVGVYDMVITSNEEYVESLRKQGLLRRVALIYAEHLLLVGPPELSSKKKELSAKATMKKIFEDEDLFFSSLDNDWVSGEEKKLWTQAGVARPYDNKNYVESGHDDIGLLIQAEEERGFALTGEASFAQYLDMQRYDPQLVVYADTGVVRTAHVCLIVNSGYRKVRTEMADRYVDWLTSEVGAALIDSFSLGAIAPFRAVRE
ncbi:hypothetical protein LJC31_01145 [Synergistaceae bacterium OttesenSCG-928-I11]|nr:hypothetical protein [Synergistaceae bacterium OttesenSCG-928-I11]